MTNIQKNSLHTINYSANEMAQKFDNQYFRTKRHKVVTPLDNYTVLVGQEIKHGIDKKEVYKTLLHQMRRIAKTNYTLKDTKEQRRPRIQYCGYSVTGNTSAPVQMCKSDKGTLFFSGVANCGSYWRCPVCALKISENKKELLTALISEHQARNLSIGFVTLTIRHKRTDTLKKSLEKLLSNYRLFQTGRFFKTHKNMMGQVKTLEVTFSEENGWHPHLHLLYFYDNNESQAIDKFQKTVISKWAKYRNNNALVKSQNQTICTSDISDYLAKYDITSEMTKGQIKSSKGLTPFTALSKIALGDYENIQQKRLLYAVYSTYVEELHGKHFVNISNSLRKEYKDFLLEFDKTDDEIVNNVTIDEVILKIDLSAWKLISKNDLQPLVLNKFASGGFDSVYKLLKYFKDFKDLDFDFDTNEVPILTIRPFPEY